MKDYTLQLSLISHDLKKEKDIISSIKTFYSDNRVQLVSEGSKLYQPYFYYTYGTNDLAVIAEINNYDFCQKGLYGKESAADFTYELSTGILNEGTSRGVGELYSENSFLFICNVKLNNGLIVGNGKNFTNAACELIKSKLVGLDYIILHSFSWFDLSILIFSNDSNLVAEKIHELRSIVVSDNDIIKNTFKKGENGKLDECDLLTDTQTHFCVNYEHLINDVLSEDKLEGVCTEIEWQVKPGHYKDYLGTLEKVGLAFEQMVLITGKNDYVASENGSLMNNYKIHKTINEELASGETNTADLVKQVRKIKTKVYFPISNNSEIKKNTHVGLRKALKEILKINFPILNNALKRQKISKLCRSNIVKMFYLYNNGIHNPALSIYFYDFSFFLGQIYKEIMDLDKILGKLYEFKSELSEKDIEVVSDLSLEKLETKYSKEFEIFESAFKARMLNSYVYEDISSISFDFNFSIQQILSLYNSLCFIVTDNLGIENNSKIITLNYRSTVANQRSIRYGIFDMFIPEFIFYTLPKEILNYSGLESEFKQIISSFEKLIIQVEDEDYDEFLHELYKMKLFDIKTLYIESYRFIYTFNMKPEVFIYWNWIYSFKTSVSYNISGSYKEDCFITELIRIVFVLKLYGFEEEIEDLKCPLPKLNLLWIKYFPKVKNAIDEIFKRNDFVMSFKWNVLEKLANILRTSSVTDYSRDSLAIRLRAYVENEIPIPKVDKERNEFIDCIISSIRSENLEEELTSKNIRNYMSNRVDNIYRRNCIEGNVNFLYRDWSSGIPLNTMSMDCFRTCGSQPMYYVDQMGSIFFMDDNCTGEYFKDRNSVLLDLWDLCARENYNIISKSK